MQGPSVYPLVPCSKDPAGGAASETLGCLATGYMPDPVTVTWDAEFPTTSMVTLPGTFIPAAGSYTTASQLAVSGEAGATCSVRHTQSGTVRNVTLNTQAGKPMPAGGGGPGGGQAGRGSSGAPGVLGREGL